LVQRLTTHAARRALPMIVQRSPSSQRNGTIRSAWMCVIEIAGGFSITTS
jgi:cobalamin biosynthesis protein CobD/CbiB